jgi:hypothetical protein
MLTRVRRGWRNTGITAQNVASTTEFEHRRQGNTQDDAWPFEESNYQTRVDDAEAKRPLIIKRRPETFQRTRFDFAMAFASAPKNSNCRLSTGALRAQKKAASFRGRDWFSVLDMGIRG